MPKKAILAMVEAEVARRRQIFRRLHGIKIATSIFAPIQNFKRREAANHNTVTARLCAAGSDIGDRAAQVAGATAAKPWRRKGGQQPAVGLAAFANAAAMHVVSICD